jgi:hypothetical protein
MLHHNDFAIFICSLNGRKHKRDPFFFTICPTEQVQQCYISTVNEMDKNEQFMKMNENIRLH